MCLSNRRHVIELVSIILAGCAQMLRFAHCFLWQTQGMRIFCTLIKFAHLKWEAAVTTFSCPFPSELCIACQRKVLKAALAIAHSCLFGLKAHTNALELTGKQEVQQLSCFCGARRQRMSYHTRMASSQQVKVFLNIVSGWVCGFVFSGQSSLHCLLGIHKPCGWSLVANDSLQTTTPLMPLSNKTVGQNMWHDWRAPGIAMVHPHQHLSLAKRTKRETICCCERLKPW